MKEQEKPTYLYVDPYCGRRQVIHIESIAGSNIVFTATFNCEEPDASGKIVLKDVEFETYPMFGVFNWGFKRIEPQKDTDSKPNSIREIKVVMGIFEVEHKVIIPFKGVTWNKGDTIDNKMFFDVLGREVEREDLKKTLKTFGLNESMREEAIAIPVDGRPCQFKLVNPMS
jgi:hypothetical protein